MASVVFGVIGGLIGGGGEAGSVGALIGQAVGAAAGAVVDTMFVYPAIFGKDGGSGPRIDDLQFQTASEGAGLNYLIGEARTAGNLIWVSELEEVEGTVGGGKGIGGGGGGASTFTYYSSIAVGVCEGPISKIKRVWADSRLIYTPEGFKNLLRWSDRFTSGDWEQWYLTIEEDGDADPLAGNRADIVTTTDARSFLVQRRIPVFDETEYTLSFYVKAGTQVGGYELSIFDMDNVPVILGPGDDPRGSEIVADETYTPGSGSYTRITRTFTTPADCRHIDIYLLGPCTTPGTVYLFGAQLEFGGSATSYESTDNVPPATADPNFDSMVVYTGTYNQDRDPTMEAALGTDNTPAYRGLAYVVFERFNLSAFGGRVPQFTFEVEETANLTTAAAITKILTRAGLDLDEIDVSDVWHQDLRGLVVNGPQTPVQLLEPILAIHNLMVVETALTLKFIQRERSTARVVAERYLAAHDVGSDTPRVITFADKGTVDLPSEVNVGYQDPELDFQRGSARERRAMYLTDGVKKYETPLVLSREVATNAAFALLHSAWSERRSAEVFLPPSFYDVEESDLLGIQVGDEQYNVRVTQVTKGDGYILQCRGVLESAQSLEAQALMFDPPAPSDLAFQSATLPATTVTEDPYLEIMDIPALRDEDALTCGFYYAACRGDPDDAWLGVGLYIDGGVGMEYSDRTSKEGIIGYTVTTLDYVDDLSVWDYVNSVTVELYNGALESRTEDEVLAGLNWALIGDEIVGFQTVLLVAPNRYTLSNLLRGRRDTGLATTLHAPDERFVLLDPSRINFRAVNLSVVGQTRDYRAVPVGKPVEDVATQIDDLVLNGETLRAFRVADVDSSRDGSNNITITWNRNTRALSDWMTLEDAARLSDETTNYEIDVLDGSDNVLRTIQTTTETASYSAADQTTDGFTPGDPVTVVIYQITTTIGRGHAARETV